LFHSRLDRSGVPRACMRSYSQTNEETTTQRNNESKVASTVVILWGFTRHSGRWPPTDRRDRDRVHGSHDSHRGSNFAEYSPDRGTLRDSGPGLVLGLVVA